MSEPLSTDDYLRVKQALGATELFVGDGRAPELPEPCARRVLALLDRAEQAEAERDALRWQLQRAARVAVGTAAAAQQCLDRGAQEAAMQYLEGIKRFLANLAAARGEKGDG